MIKCFADMKNHSDSLIREFAADCTDYTKNNKEIGFCVPMEKYKKMFANKADILDSDPVFYYLHNKEKSIDTEAKPNPQVPFTKAKYLIYPEDLYFPGRSKNKMQFSVVANEGLSYAYFSKKWYPYMERILTGKIVTVPYDYFYLPKSIEITYDLVKNLIEMFKGEDTDKELAISILCSTNLDFLKSNAADKEWYEKKQLFLTISHVVYILNIISSDSVVNKYIETKFRHNGYNIDDISDPECLELLKELVIKRSTEYIKGNLYKNVKFKLEIESWK